jgi:hypothetical protein
MVSFTFRLLSPVDIIPETLDRILVGLQSQPACSEEEKNL